MTLVDRKTIQIGSTILVDIDPDYDYVQVRMGSGEREVTERVKKVDLYAAVFALADPKTQDALMPVRQTRMMTFERIHNVQMKKDMKKGQILKLRCHIDVPLQIEESLKGIITDRQQRAAAVGTILS